MKTQWISMAVLGLLIWMAPNFAGAQKQVTIDMTASIIKKVDGKLVGGWNPKKITVNQGDEVTLKIKSLDAEHVFSLEGYNIEKEVIPGQPVEVHFTADKAGLFYFRCGMECGPYHRFMLGQFIVEKQP